MNQKLQTRLTRRIAKLGIVAMLSAVSLGTWALNRIQDIRTVKVSISFNGETLEKAFGRLSEVSKMPFNYNHNELRKISTKQLVFKNEPLPQVLNSILYGTQFQYKEGESGVIIFKTNEKQDQRVNSITNAIDPITIKGIVSDNAGPVPGVSVMVKGTGKGTITAADGSFSIKAEKGEVLVFSTLGYKTKEITVDDQTTVNISLEASVNSLEDVVVVGYGQQKKINLTGAVGTISSKDLDNRPVTNVTNAIQGKVAGVSITTSTGQPGRDAGTIRIRGIGTGLGSGGASAAPIVIIDGVPGAMGDVNPNDIESISVLKDAASSAIYGARASNGVILITTKKGKEGSIQLKYDMYAGPQQIMKQPDFLPSWQQAQLYNEARANEGASLRWTDNDIQLFKDGTDQSGAHPNTDWVSLIFSETGWQQNHNVNISGGDQKSKYMVSLGYFDQNGNVKETRYQKYNALFNVNSQLTPKLGLTAKLGFLYAPFSEPVSTYATSFGQIIRAANRISNTVPAKWENGALGYVSDGSPLAWLDSPSFNKWQNYTVNGNVAGDWSPLKGLHFKPSFGYRLAMGQQQQYVSDIQYYKGGATGTPLTPTKFEGPNNLTNATDRTTYTLLQGVADYEKNIGKHNFKVLVGASQEYSIYNYFSAQRQNFLNNELTQINAAPALGQSTTGYANDWGLKSVFGRLNYNFNEKYLLEANFRFDGSSRFAQGHRWGKFPAVSAGWIISKEDFFASALNAVNSLKLRASWGKLGNQQIANNYAYFESITGGQTYSFNQTLVTGLTPGDGANPLLQWEKTQSVGAGIDATFMNNKLDVSLDYFERKTSNPLLRTQAGAVLGTSGTTSFVPPYVNVDGEMVNKGIEVSAGYKDKVGEFNYNINGNFSFIDNKVTKLTGGKVINDNTFYDVGTPFQSLYGYEALGIYKTQADVTGTAVLNNKVAAGDIQYKDQNNDGKIDAQDKVYLGNYYPKISYGLSFSSSWKNFELSLFFQGAAAVKAMGGNLIGRVGPDVEKPTSVFLDRWTPTNTDASFPRLWYSYKQNDPTSTPSSFWVKDASYLRLKNLTFAYSLPKNIVNKLGLNNVKVYYSGQNLLTFTSFYKWIDPELGSAGSINNYPQVLVNTLGLNVTF
ncbi:TonB-dependent receptor [Pedobacter sp. HDW13]|uniref:TonB-dependent receptor n=1 Tax=Pedobacter sp. HDW13 TaxID=2714940 RepID=UPI00140C4788|nr:TonB-dependent receptor [Pedobacter sp. HDW13]QIL41647.1 TonB-dependent receptor [Pedobacter sp. HDW13]